MLKKNFTSGTHMMLSQLVEFSKDRSERDDSFCVYTKKPVSKLTVDLDCFLDGYPKVIDDKDVYPPFVIEHQLHLAYYGDQFVDVIDNVFDQRPNASAQDFVKALNYYLDNDDFLDF